VFPGGISIPQKATCPSDTKVVSGGGAIGGPAGTVALSGSEPFDNGDPGKRPDDGWRVYATNTTLEDRFLTAYAVCAKSGRYEYVSAEWSQGSGRSAGTAECPAGTNVMSGGGTSDGKHTSIELAESHPYNEDADPEPAESWFTGWNAEISVGTYITVWAVCTPRPMEYVPVAASLGTPISSFQQGCDGQRVFGGGVDQAGNSLDVFITATYPHESSLWGLVMSNVSGFPANVTVWSVCKGA
jgi:hypothetical protein